jgi:16S rRNA (guanine527-N7)-methyltransferase
MCFRNLKINPAQSFPNPQPRIYNLESPMNPARLAELLDPFLRAPITLPEVPTLLEHCHSDPAKAGEEPAVLSSAQLQSISTYIDILIRWNARINLTAIRDPEDIVPRHFGESLFAARHLFPDGGAAGKRAVLDTRGGRAALQGRARSQEGVGALAPEATANQQPATNIRLADIGSGAGFPGLPIKLWAPAISLSLIESNHKKAAFLREVTRALTLTDVDIQNTRAETLAAKFDIVTLRAVERFEAILPIAAALVGPAGRLALLISAAQQDQARAMLPNLTWSTPAPVPHSRSRVLLVARSDQEIK